MDIPRSPNVNLSIEQNNNNKFSRYFSFLKDTRISRQPFNPFIVPSPYILAPDGAPITKVFCSKGKDCQNSFLAFNRAYCLNAEINIDNPQTFKPSFNEYLNEIGNLNILDSDSVFTIKASILHVHRIIASWFCLNCLEVFDANDVCSCGMDHCSDPTWKSMSIYLVGSLEVESNDSSPKLFPFVMTNWNVMKFLSFADQPSLKTQSPRALFKRIIDLAGVFWRSMENPICSENMRNFYSFGECFFDDEVLNIIYRDRLRSSEPSGIIGQVRLVFDNEEINIPSDPISNLEMEVCLRYTRTCDNESSTFRYLHVVRWKFGNARLELANKLKEFN
ncbi:hypothetical protein HWI79_2405 [Cryptosporidium felis]|nr:hypothetical protein HWI79_2405 [Cryptosporidium felis]